jgi:transposase
MLLKTILNRVQKYGSFVYDRVSWIEQGGRPGLLVLILPRAGSRPVCPGCGRRRGCYDRQPARFYDFVPLWGLPVVFEYAARRVNCARCGVRVEKLPWAQGKSQLTEAYAWFLAGWAKRLSWKQVAEVFHTSWDTVYRAVSRAVQWGLVHRRLEGLEAIGVDEVCWRKGHQYLTVVYQLDAGARRLLWIGEHRKAKTLLRFFRWLGKERTAQLSFVCSDMWRAYLKVIAKKAGHALHVLDRYHLVARLNKAVDKVRAEEVRRLKAEGYDPVLTHARWCLLKNPTNLTAGQEVKLADLLRYNLRSVRAYLLKEQLQLFWGYVSPYWAGRYLDHWCRQVMRSRLEPLKAIARSMRSHRELILNWFRAKKAISAGVVEGFNNKLKLTTRKAYGFRSYKVAEVALYHALGELPEPNFTHRFC